MASQEQSIQAVAAVVKPHLITAVQVAAQAVTVVLEL
jgi:hypothetical protein